MTPVIEILQEFLFLSVVFKLVDNIVNGALSNRSKLYDTIIETKKLADLRKAYHCSSIAQLFSRPLKSILLSDIQQYNYQTSIVNLQVFVSLGIETCRFL